jgi:hypothetical protein
VTSLASTTISLASVHLIWDNTIGQVNTLVLDVLPYVVPAMLLLGAVFMLWHKAKRYVGGIK